MIVSHARTEAIKPNLETRMHFLRLQSTNYFQKKQKKIAQGLSEETIVEIFDVLSDDLESAISVHL